jgi:HEAT repeat protein
MKVVRESESRTEDEFWTDCANACAILAEIGPAAMAAIHVLRRWVRRPIYDQMRLHAAVALWSINGNAEEALATARAWIGDEDRWIRCWAADLLGHLEPAARPMEADLQGLLNDEEEHVRRQAAKALAKIVPAE